MATQMFEKLIVANRGEIACRVIRTAKRMGIQTVAVFSEADAKSLHVQQADEAYCIGPAPAIESYLNQDAVLQAALKSKSQALHPGYGFLSENAKFSQACLQNGIEFVGPPAQAILDMGSKSKSKQLMEEAKVPIVPGYHQDNQEYQHLKKQADAIGYPVLIKAVMGGGGKGMKLAFSPSEFEEQLQSAMREARQSFGDDRVILERYIQRPRHIEIQVFCDKQGNGVYLFERDCSIQRRHQKVIEEAPSLLGEDQRILMGNSAVQAARAVGYVGAGTVEFIYDEDSGEYFFMEMNTRLQVEHPVTEMITGVDLVEWQLRVASGEPLPLLQEQIQRNGHAIEARVYAEDPANGFLPSTGNIVYFRLPELRDGIRVDTGIQQGSEISVFYDPMIAKVIAWGNDRRQASNRLHKALTEFQIAGVTTNIPLLTRVLRNEEFQKGDFNTLFLNKHQDVLKPYQPTSRQLAASAVCHIYSQIDQDKSVWGSLSGFRLNGEIEKLIKLDEQDVRVSYNGSKFKASVGNQTFSWDVSGSSPIYLSDQHSLERWSVAESGGVLYAMPENSEVFKLQLESTEHDYEQISEASGVLKANMAGRISKIFFNVGEDVKVGDAVVVLESMKMEHIIRATKAGKVTAVNVAAGDFVKSGQGLIGIE